MMNHTIDEIRSLAPLAMAALCCALTAPITTACDGKPEAARVTAQAASPHVEAWLGGLSTSIKERATASATRSKLKEAIEAQAAKAGNPLKGYRPQHAVLASQVYRAREWAPGLVRAGDLGASAKALIVALGELENHGLEPQAYDRERIGELVDQLEGLSDKLKAVGEFKPGKAEREFAMAYVTSQAAADYKLDATSHGALTDALLASDAGAGLQDKVRAYEEAGRSLAGTEAELERLLAYALVQYAYEMKYFTLPTAFVHPRHDDYYNDPDVRTRRPDKAKGPYRAGKTWRKAVFTAQAVAKAHKRTILDRHIVATLRAALEAKDDSVIKGLEPDQPQYRKLMAEHQRYRALVEAGGWSEVEPVKSLRKGSASATVAALKARLQKEGYFPSEADASGTRFDATLLEAVKAYQRTHQMKPDGKPGRTFWRSLNRSASKRAKQIRINLQRWRASNIRHDEPTYVFVNIADFNLELWHEGERDLRFKVVTGNNDFKIPDLAEDDDDDNEKLWREKKRDLSDREIDEMTHPNRTPTVSAYIDRIIYNPFWNITPRIREEETLQDVRMWEEKRYIKRIDGLAGRSEMGLLGMPGMGGPSADEQGQPQASPYYTLPRKPRRRKAYPKPVQFNTEKLRELYVSKLGAEPDWATVYPYLNMELGVVDVSVTKPAQIPGWYEANGYEVMQPGKSWEYVRQLPGKDNLLGRVKVIFPNPYDIYLHDTPFKGPFGLNVRASSHGCVRMHKPLKMAKRLLELQGLDERYKVKKILKEGEHTPIYLPRRIPVHVEYFTVRVDDEGRANFLADVYSKDRWLM